VFLPEKGETLDVCAATAADLPTEWMSEDCQAESRRLEKHVVAALYTCAALCPLVVWIVSHPPRLERPPRPVAADVSLAAVRPEVSQPTVNEPIRVELPPAPRLERQQERSSSTSDRRQRREAVQELRSPQVSVRTISFPPRKIATEAPVKVPALPAPPAPVLDRLLSTVPAPDSAPRPPVAVATTGNDEDAVRRALSRYQSAYDRLDAGAAKAVWPAVNAVALGKAFQDLASQDISFDDCRFDLAGTRAHAWCKGSARYVGRVGSRTVREEPRQWTFVLSKAEESWRIDDVQTRR
jgi:hypothetical protein